MTEVIIEPVHDVLKSEIPSVVYSSYTESQKKATLKYREKNKDKVNEQRKVYYQQRKESDPNFLEYKRAKSREYYQRKKALKNNSDEEVELVKIDIVEPQPEPEILSEEHKEDLIKEVIESTIEEVIKEKKPRKKSYKKELIEFDKTEEPEKKVEEEKPKPKPKNKREKKYLP